jgi:hypothetical protein
MMLCAAACSERTPALPDGQIYPPGSTVRATVSVRRVLTLDDTPVRTELYPYSASEPRNPDIVSGPPIAFVFPKFVYWTEENRSGGPQYSIELLFDRITLRPIGSLMAGRRYTPTNDLQKVYSSEFRSRDLNLRIDSNFVRGSMDFSDRYFDTNSDLSPVIGRACGFEFKRDLSRGLRAGPPLLVDGFNLNSATLEGRATAQGNPSRLIRCSQFTRSCRVSFGIANRVASYAIDKRRLCEHRDLTPRIYATIIKHRVL